MPTYLIESSSWPGVQLKGVGSVFLSKAQGCNYGQWKTHTVPGVPSDGGTVGSVDFDL
jgi:hypothetical protein